MNQKELEEEGLGDSVANTHLSQRRIRMTDLNGVSFHGNVDAGSVVLNTEIIMVGKIDNVENKNVLIEFEK